MTDEDFAARLRAVERAVTDGDATVADLSEAAAVHDRLDEIEADLAALAERLDALDATVQSLHGYVGEIDHVNERVERRADAARAAVERLEDERRRAPQTDTEPATRTQETTAERAPEAGGERARERPGSDDLPADLEAAVADAEADRHDGDESDDDPSLFDRVRASL